MVRVEGGDRENVEMNPEPLFLSSVGAAIIVGRELGVEFGRKEPEVRELTIDDLTFPSFLRL